MAGVRKKPKSGKYQGWFVDSAGKRRFFSGTRSKVETLHIANSLEEEHRQIRLGYRSAPRSADKHRTRSFEEVKEEYLEWGRSQGGRNGKAWGEVHERHRRTRLGWWRDRLGLETLADLVGVLPRAEKALRELQDQGRAGKTLANYAEALGALCDWCVVRGYLDADPLQSLGAFDTTPRSTRRAMTVAEIKRLLSACSPHRRLLLETAFLSGLRVRELRSLTRDHLDVELCGLQLDADWTKNRQSGFQPLPASLVKRLDKFAESGEASRLYAERYRRRDTKLEAPENPLLYVPIHTARDLDKDLAATGIQKYAPNGKLDFHSCRVAYINLVIESGVTVKEAQTLARHSTPHLTMNVYGRVREARLSEAVEKVAQVISESEECALCVPKKESGEDEEFATSSSPETFANDERMEVGGVEPPSESTSTGTSTCVAGCFYLAAARSSRRDQDTASPGVISLRPPRRGTKPACFGDALNNPAGGDYRGRAALSSHCIRWCVCS